MALLQAGAEAALPALHALLGDRGLLPQQVMGSLSFVATLLSDMLAQLTDPTAFAKYRRLKLTAVRKRAPNKPELVEAVLKAAGFAPVPTGGAEESEHLEWGPDEATALPSALAVLVLIGRIQERGETAAGRRALADPLDTRIRVQDVLALKYSREHLLELRPAAGAAPIFGGTQRAGNSKGALVQRQWLQERLPHIISTLDEILVNSLFDTGARERAAVAAVVRTLNEVRAHRGLQEKLVVMPYLREAAQVVASMVLTSLRRPELREQPTSPAEEAEKEMLRAQAAAARQAAEPCVEPIGDARSDGTEPYLGGIEAVERALVPALFECVPGFRLGFPFAATTEILHMREVPAFFTCGIHEKPFEVSCGMLGEYLLSSMTSKAAAGSEAELMLSETVSTLGVGCAVNIGNDDKALVCVIVA